MGAGGTKLLQSKAPSPNASPQHKPAIRDRRLLLGEKDQSAQICANAVSDSEGVAAQVQTGWRKKIRLHPVERLRRKRRRVKGKSSVFNYWGFGFIMKI